jgi:hypothetical protein
LISYKIRKEVAKASGTTFRFSEGRRKLRFEFEVTGKPDVKNGKGAPGRGQLYIDGKLVGQGHIPLTMPLMIGLCGGMVSGAGSPVLDKYDPPSSSPARSTARPWM